MTIKKVKIPIYSGTLRIVISKDFKKACKKLGKDITEFNVSDYAAFVYTERTKKRFSLFTVIISPKCSESVIAHECVHLVNAVFIEHHIQLDRHNDEPQAYLTGWFVRQIHKAINN